MMASLARVAKYRQERERIDLKKVFIVSSEIKARHQIYIYREYEHVMKALMAVW